MPCAGGVPPPPRCQALTSHSRLDCMALGLVRERPLYNLLPISLWKLPNPSTPQALIGCEQDPPPKGEGASAARAPRDPPNLRCKLEILAVESAGSASS